MHSATLHYNKHINKLEPMAIGLRQTQTATQAEKQKMRQTQVQNLSIRTSIVLSKSLYDYTEYLKDEIEKNPVLETMETPEEENVTVEEMDRTQALDAKTIEENYDVRLLNSLDNKLMIGKPLRNNDDDGEYDPLANVAVEKSFTEMLMEQISTDNETERMALEYLINSLDSKGFLTDTPQQLAYFLVKDIYPNYDELDYDMQVKLEDRTAEVLQNALSVLQTFEPAGVGALNESECLVLQLQRKNDSPAAENAINIIRDHYKAFFNLGDSYDSAAGKQFAHLMCRNYHMKPREYTEAVALIRTLNPYPSRGFTSDTVAVQVPEFYVKVIGDNDIMIIQNLGHLPRFRRAEDIRQYQKNNKGKGSSSESYKQNIAQASTVLQDYHLRNTVLMEVMIAIVKLQRDFFINNSDAYIKPCTRRELTSMINVDRKLMSYHALARAVKNRYVCVENDVYPMSKFFNTAIPLDEGDKQSSVSSAAVKDRIAEVVYDENGKLRSDITITKILNEEGYKIARRTVAKYRKAINIEKPYHSEKRVSKSNNKRK